MICPICGVESKDDSNYCRSCGAPLMDVRILDDQSGEELQRSQAMLLNVLNQSVGRLNRSQEAQAAHLAALRKQVADLHATLADEDAVQSVDVLNFDMEFGRMLSFVFRLWFASLIVGLLIWAIIVLVAAIAAAIGIGGISALLQSVGLY